MRGLRYFLVVVVAATGLALAARLVYSRNRLAESAQPSTPVVLASKPVALPDSQRQPRQAAPQPESSPSSAPTQLKHASVSPPRSKPAITEPVRSTQRPRPTATLAQPAPQETQPALPAPQPPLPSDTPPAAPAAEPSPVWQASPRQIARDSAYVMVSSGRLQAAIAVLDAWVRSNPSDTAVVLDLARLKARAGDWDGSLSLYSSLVEQHRTAQFLFERGQAYLWSGDARRGEADLLASEALSPRAETERQLGDHYRWQGDYARSASWYRQALRRAPNDTIARNSMEVLDRAVDIRLMLPGELSGNDFGSAMQAISDNAGFDLYSVRLSQAFAPASTFVVTMSGELRSAVQMFGTNENRLDAYGFDVLMASRVGLSKLTASVGVLQHGDDLSSIVRGSLTADGFVGNARLKASVHRAPAYETLWAPRMLGVSGSPSTTLGTQGSLSLPLGIGNELYAMGELLSVSDDNSRTAFQLALRRRLPSWFSLIYAGSFMSYRDQTAFYYSPARYVSHSLGLELARYREQGFSFALRATPGYAWMREPAGTADSTTRDLSAFQFTTGMELGYRRGAWDLLFSSGFSDGREGGYQSRNALLFLRRAW